MEESTANFLGTKAEIKLKKAEPGAWAKLDIPRVVKKVEEVKKIETPVVNTPQDDDDDDDDDDFDLDDLNLGSTKMTLSKEASNGRTSNEIV